MRYLSGSEEEKALQYITKVAQVALQSNCLSSRCGAVIVKDDNIIGSGFNSPPQDRTLEFCLKDNLPDDFKSDKTCCVHAEQRAIINALRDNGEEITGSRLYFIRLDEKGNQERAGKLYCTICSKMTLDVGIAEFVLWCNEGVCVYTAEEYNTLSFQFSQKR